MKSNPQSPHSNTNQELTSISGEPVPYLLDEAPPEGKETVMKLSSLLLATVGAVVLTVVVLAVVGVRFRGPVAQGAALYDPKAEITVTGVVTEVRDFACPVSEGEMGTHLVLRTAQGDVIVHLAPGRVMRSQKIAFAPGEKLTVVGARAGALGSRDVIAREVAGGGADYVFRDKAGNLMLVQ